MKYVYTAIFSPEPSDTNKNLLSVVFPDIQMCHTCGQDLLDAMEMAADVLCLCLYHLEEEGEDIPDPTPPQNIKVEGNDFITAIAVDTNYYRQFFANYANQAIAN